MPSIAPEMRLGVDLCWFTEHRFVEDGYLASWVPVAAAMAARTQRIRFSCDVCLLPFNHPIRLAEDLAVLDTISNGRFPPKSVSLRALAKQSPCTCAG